MLIEEFELDANNDKLLGTTISVECLSQEIAPMACIITVILSNPLWINTIDHQTSPCMKTIRHRKHHRHNTSNLTNSHISNLTNNSLISTRIRLFDMFYYNLILGNNHILHGLPEQKISVLAHNCVCFNCSFIHLFLTYFKINLQYLNRRFISKSLTRSLTL